MFQSPTDCIYDEIPLDYNGAKFPVKNGMICSLGRFIFSLMRIITLGLEIDSLSLMAS